MYNRKSVGAYGRDPSLAKTHNIWQLLSYLVPIFKESVCLNSESLVEASPKLKGRS